jgi:phosphoglycerol transferase MdoB-like AlkP superfamily enzyme
VKVVKYTDFAMKKFFEMAEKQPWFSNTVFVIVADHCALAPVELPVDKYRIPAMICVYSATRYINQIDITLLVIEF